MKGVHADLNHLPLSLNQRGIIVFTPRQDIARTGTGRGVGNRKIPVILASLSCVLNPPDKRLRIIKSAVMFTVKTIISSAIQ